MRSSLSLTVAVANQETSLPYPTLPCAMSHTTQHDMEKASNNRLRLKCPNLQQGAREGALWRRAANILQGEFYKLLRHPPAILENAGEHTSSSETCLSAIADLCSVCEPHQCEGVTRVSVVERCSAGASAPFRVKGRSGTRPSPLVYGTSRTDRPHGPP
ncbi:hypothetical protein JZ751_010531 [Albula glossodonta]|uniref:Uncharacterized protein n=1 Tax=Albula glossodonta TaxID=121402 RepID=A0A8T2P5F8_9TELE|nr:hypothetical protein JZ751_010531 [Albula glossodonta]